MGPCLLVLYLEGRERFCLCWNQSSSRWNSFWEVVPVLWQGAKQFFFNFLKRNSGWGGCMWGWGLSGRVGGGLGNFRNCNVSVVFIWWIWQGFKFFKNFLYYPVSTVIPPFQVHECICWFLCRDWSLEYFRWVISGGDFLFFLFLSFSFTRECGGVLSFTGEDGREMSLWW